MQLLCAISACNGTHYLLTKGHLRKAQDPRAPNHRKSSTGLVQSFASPLMAAILALSSPTLITPPGVCRVPELHGVQAPSTSTTSQPSSPRLGNRSNPKSPPPRATFLLCVEDYKDFMFFYVSEILLHGGAFYFVRRLRTYIDFEHPSASLYPKGRPCFRRLALAAMIWEETYCSLNGVSTEDGIYDITYYGKGRMPGFGEKCTPRGRCTFGPRLEEEIKLLAEFVKSQADEGWPYIESQED